MIADQEQATQSSGSPVDAVTVPEAYAVCRQIARREAKNFYYSFVALPAERRDAMCAIYAFMRRADDLSDDESQSRTDRRANLMAWLAEWHRVREGVTSSDAVFLAVRDAARRFAIPFALLDELVAGTTMDLEESAASRAGRPDTYASYEELDRYCYLVASVVGLVCIRIFGYEDERAEKLAEQTGIAFQLTNILRDVREDAARNRVYLPLSELARHGVTVEQLLHRDTMQINDRERALLQSVGARAEQMYAAARELLPLIEPMSRPALWVLVTIYHQLLRRMERERFEVMARRIAVPTWQKVAILLIGMAWMGWVRVFQLHKFQPRGRNLRNQ